MREPLRFDLFIHDTNTLHGDILVDDDGAGSSQLKYQEYAVFAHGLDNNNSSSTHVVDCASSTRSDSCDSQIHHHHHHQHIAQCTRSTHGRGDLLFSQALRGDYALDVHGDWTCPSSAAAAAPGHGHDHHHNGPVQLQGRVRQVICQRRPHAKSTPDTDLDGLHLTGADYAAMDLHPATLQYVRRRAVESMFWDRHHRKLSIVLSFPMDARAPYDFLSMTYSIADRTATVLIRQSPSRQQQQQENAGDETVPDPAGRDQHEYDVRMQACKSHWAHPLVIPVMLLQVQFTMTERAVAETRREVIAVERDVSNMAGFDAIDEQARLREQQQQKMASAVSIAPAKRRGSGHSRSGSTSRGLGLGASGGGGGGQQQQQQQQQQQVYKKSTELMKNAHEALKRSIRLLNTLEWFERTIHILLAAGDELDDVRQNSENHSNHYPGHMHTFSSSSTTTTTTSAPGGSASAPSPPPSSAVFPTPLSVRGKVGTGFLRARIVDDPLAGHWHEIRQYLEGLLQLCQSLKTDRNILEMRCKALVDIIYSKIAQEDNSLNARMAVASSRDSSSMKALAIITAVFLPGEFVSSLFGMGIFDWQANEDDGGGDSSDGGGTEAVVGYDFWWFWAITVPLTIIILVLWRAWWVGQDRYFRKHLSKDLSEERYWTDDRQPRQLETSFLYDFMYMSVRKGETTAAESESPSAGFFSSLGLTKSKADSSDDEGVSRLQLFTRPSGGKDSLISPPTFRLRQVVTDDAKEERHSGVF